MTTDTPAIKYPPFQPGFFTERACKLLCAIGEGALTQMPRNVGPTVRNHHIARQAIFQKYLTPADIATAAWIHAKDNREHPDWNNMFSGTEHLNNLLTERSDGHYAAEIVALAQSLSAPANYLKNRRGFPMPVELAEMRAQQKREKFVVIAGGRGVAAPQTEPAPA